MSAKLPRRTGAMLWVLQALLAALFLFAGAVKLMMPPATLSAQSGFSIEFMRFISTAELLGALGLVLPGLFRVERRLTPIAASGLLVIMIGAVAVSIVRMGAAAAVLPFVVGLLLVVVAYGRRGWLQEPASRSAATRSCAGAEASV